MGRGGRRKRSKALLPTKNKFWCNIVYSNEGKSGPEFQTPQHQQETILDLTDDTSPNIPITTENVQSPSQETQDKKPEVVSKSPIVLGLNPAVQKKQEEGSQQTPTDSNKSGANTTPQEEVAEGSSSGPNKKIFVCLPEKPTTSNVPVGQTIVGQTINARITRGQFTETKPKPKKEPKKPKKEPPQSVKPVQYRLPTPQQVTGFNPNPYAPQQGPTDPYAPNYPKGIPRSFLMGSGIPQTYAEISQNMSDANAAAPAWPQVNPTNMYGQVQTNPSFIYDFKPVVETTENPMYLNTDPIVNDQPYSPSDVYADNILGNSMEDTREGSESSDVLESGQKRLSAFQRLGPLTQPKKPKLTINLMCNKEQSVREVVDETDQKNVPVHLREDIINSKDETVMKFLKIWPWAKPMPLRKSVRARTSKSVMMLEHEQMEELYEKDWFYFQISVQGYPPEWSKEKLLDSIMDGVYGKSFIPLFIHYTPQECKFLVNRCRAALNAIHKAGFVIRIDGEELHFEISHTDLSTNKLDFIPKLVLRKRLSMGYDNEKRLDISAFTLKEDISHFIYYPLNRAVNQADLIQLKSTIAWNFLTELNLSHNRITTIDGFDLPATTPKLQRLDLSYNCIQKVTVLLRCRELNLRSLSLEGNPLCHDYIDPAHYVRVLKMMFPALTEIDGEQIKLYGEMPKYRRNYCPEDAKDLIEKFLEIFFPLLDASDKDRSSIEEMYHENATMTVTYRFKLRYGPIYRKFANIFNRSRVIAEGDTDSTDGAADIARLISKWPPLKHDPFTFTVDVMHHDDFLTVFKVAGILKLTSETLAEDEHLLSFIRTFVLHSEDGVNYKITNDMVYWDQPSKEYANTAFQITTVRPKRLSLKMESPPNEELKEKLVELFMQITDLSKTASERCLEHKDWNMKSALEYFTKLVKLDEIEFLSKEI